MERRCRSPGSSWRSSEPASSPGTSRSSAPTTPRRCGTGSRTSTRTWSGPSRSPARSGCASGGSTCARPGTASRSTSPRSTRCSAAGARPNPPGAGDKNAMASRLLIAVGAAAENPEQIPEGVRLLLDQAEEILVISPALPDRVHWLVSDTDKARSAADERLATVLGHLEEIGHGAEGEVGADDPILAFADAVDEFHPDHILVGL